MLKFVKYFSLIFFLISGNIVSSAENAEKLLTTDWTFKGPFGKFDRASLQRGYQVYQEVCASCHSLKYICLLYTSPSPRDATLSRMPSSA